MGVLPISPSATALDLRHFQAMNRSIELPIYNYDGLRPYSSHGDSSSLVVNNKGEMVGLIHFGKLRSAIGPAGTWVTFAATAWRVREWIKEIYPDTDFDCEIW